MTDFYTNKYPIQGCITDGKGKWNDLPEGNIFTIVAIQNDFFVLKPVTKIEDLIPVVVSVNMLNRGFTKSENIKS